MPESISVFKVWLSMMINAKGGTWVIVYRVIRGLGILALQQRSDHPLILGCGPGGRGGHL